MPSATAHASAVIIANEVAAIPGVTGLVVNPRIGSVTLTVADAAAKARTLAYFESLAVNPPILRPDRAVIAAEDLEAAAPGRSAAGHRTAHHL